MCFAQHWVVLWSGRAPVVSFQVVRRTRTAVERGHRTGFLKYGGRRLHARIQFTTLSMRSSDVSAAEMAASCFSASAKQRTGMARHAPPARFSRAPPQAQRGSDTSCRLRPRSWSAQRCLRVPRSGAAERGWQVRAWCMPLRSGAHPVARRTAAAPRRGAAAAPARRGRSAPRPGAAEPALRTPAPCPFRRPWPRRRRLAAWP